MSIGRTFRVCRVRSSLKQVMVLIIAVLQSRDAFDVLDHLVEKLSLLKIRKTFLLGSSVAVNDTNCVVAIDYIVQISEFH